MWPAEYIRPGSAGRGDSATGQAIAGSRTWVRRNWLPDGSRVLGGLVFSKRAVLRAAVCAKNAGRYERVPGAGCSGVDQCGAAILRADIDFGRYRAYDPRASVPCRLST